jgi:hypothetical protein
MPGSPLIGLGFGLAMFAFTALGFLLRKRGQKRAAEELPKLALELKLLLVPARHARALGQLKGSYQGYEVRVDPEESRSISVRFRGSPKIDLRSYQGPIAPPYGWVTLSSGDRAFDRFFKTRFIASELAQSLVSDQKPSSLLEPFRGAYDRRVKALTVSADGVRCELDFGNPPHVPASAIRVLLPACVALCAFIESRVLEPGGGQPSEQVSEAPP